MSPPISSVAELYKNLPAELQLTVVEFWLRTTTATSTMRQSVARRLADHFNRPSLKHKGIRKLPSSHPAYTKLTIVLDRTDILDDGSIYNTEVPKSPVIPSSCCLNQQNAMTWYTHLSDDNTKVINWYSFQKNVPCPFCCASLRHLCTGLVNMVYFRHMYMRCEDKTTGQVKTEYNVEFMFPFQGYSYSIISPDVRSLPLSQLDWIHKYLKESKQ